MKEKISKFQIRIEDNILKGPEILVNKEPLAEMLLNTLRSKPDCIGQVDSFTGKQCTYADMSKRSIRCALWLQQQGMKSGDIIGLCTDSNLDAIIVLLGVMYLNGKCNTWDYELSLMTARYFLSLTLPKIIFTIPISAATLKEAAKELKLDVKIVVLGKLDGYESMDDIIKDNDSREIAEFKCTPISNSNEASFIVFSSGTTGMPKATEIIYSSLHYCLYPQKIAKLTNNVFYIHSTLRWIYGISIALQAIVSYSTTILVPKSLIDIDAEYICKIVEKYQVTLIATIPNTLINFIKMDLLKKYHLPTLRIVFVTGSNFPKQYQETFAKKLPHVLITNIYGSTDVGRKLTEQSEHYKPGSVGFLEPNVQIKVTDTKTEEALGINKIGEIRVKTPTIMKGYYRDPEATKNAFDSNGWFRIGDVGYYDANGELFIVGRISEFINFKGSNILPEEIETVLQTHPAVLRAAVIGIPHEIDNEHPMAIVSVARDKTVTEQ
ncbi:PREDICTED: luciferin 4-monooxygenase-like, partial [Wasmannia auropunctata]|uniref:luciferin 4-monooxygenase-like n=1 Tax=Wasmannia auropunctata TaxID=64793 RepID=UPI0005F0A07E